MTCKQCFANQSGYFDELLIQNLVCVVVKIIDYSWVNGSYMVFYTSKLYMFYKSSMCFVDCIIHVFPICHISHFKII